MKAAIIAQTCKTAKDMIEVKILANTYPIHFPIDDWKRALLQM